MMLGEGDGMGKEVEEMAEEGSHFQWRGEKNPGGKELPIYLIGDVRIYIRRGKPKFLLLNQSTTQSKSQKQSGKHVQCSALYFLP